MVMFLLWVFLLGLAIVSSCKLHLADCLNIFEELGLQILKLQKHMVLKHQRMLGLIHTPTQEMLHYLAAEKKNSHMWADTKDQNRKATMLKYLKQSVFIFHKESFPNSVEIQREQALKPRFSKIWIFDNKILSFLILCLFVYNVPNINKPFLVYNSMKCYDVGEIQWML